MEEGTVVRVVASCSIGGGPGQGEGELSIRGGRQIHEVVLIEGVEAAEDEVELRFMVGLDE